MNDIQKTITFVVVALLLMGAALWRTPSTYVTEATFNDQGQLFFPNFKDPLECTSLEVIDYDPSTATATPFKVMFKDGKWVIPSHHNYPADAKDRLAKTAAGVMDLKKDAIRSDRTEDHETLGVIDPLDSKTTTLQGRGKRVTLKNKSDEVLADFIIGKAVPGTGSSSLGEEKGRGEQHFVRVPGQKRTYAVNVKVDLSTRFADWIETNLLKLDASRVRKLLFDNHKVIPEEGRIQQGEVFTVDRKDSAAPWTLEGVKLEPSQEVNTDKLSSLTSALADLKIVGVRPKPAGLTRDLKEADSKGMRLSNASLLSLQSKGFYLYKGRLLSNQGDLIVTGDDGVSYTLRFGEVLFDRGDALSAGLDDEAAGKAKESEKGKEKSKDAEEKEKEKANAGTESRYLFVTVDFDEKLIPEPTPEAEPELPRDAFQRDKNDPENGAADKAAKEKAERDKADYEKKVKEGRDRAKDLTDRFAAWYYVVPGDSFRNLMLDKASLVREKSAAKPPGAPGGFPGGPGGFPGGLPQGLPPGLGGDAPHP